MVQRCKLMPWDIIVYILYYFTREADQQIWNYSVQLIMNCTICMVIITMMVTVW